MARRRPALDRRARALPGCVLALIYGFITSAVSAQEARPWRLSASADWSIAQTDSTLDGVDSSTTLLQQKYAVDLSGIIWDPRFAHFSLGVDLTDSSLENGTIDQETRGLGYRAQANFFPGRALPITLYGRRSAVDATGAALASADSETDAWGARVALFGGGNQSLNFQFDRSAFNLLAPLPLKERRSIGAANFSRRHENGELTFRYGYLDRQERVNGTDFTRNGFYLSDRVRLGEITTLRVDGQHTLSDARFAGGETDELKVYRVSTTMDFSPASGRDSMVGYSYNDNRGRFVDSVSHSLRTRSRFPMGELWSANLGVQAGTLRNRSDASSSEQDRAGARSGIRYSQGWKRTSVSAGYGIGYSREWFSAAPDRSTVSHAADLGARLQLTRRSDLSGSAAYRTDQSDQTGTAYSVDELRASLRWGLKLGGDWRMSSSVTRTLTERETLNLGFQESDELSVASTLDHSSGGFSLAWSHVEGLSELLPDPAAATPFTPGPDAVSESDTLSLMAHWRPTPFLRASLLARGESRDFSSLPESEEYFTFQPEVQYSRNTWTVSANYVHYQRQNGFDLVEDAWGLKVGKRFY